MSTSEIIRIDINATPGYAKVIETLQRFPERSTDLIPLNRNIANKLVEFVDLNFEEGGRPQKWAPLATSTIERKRKMGITNPERALHQDGLLRQRLTPDYAYDYASAGTRTPYAAIQHFGGQAGRGKKVTIPARPYMVLTEEDVDELVGVIEKHLLGPGV